MRTRLGPILLALVIILFGVGLWNGYSRGGQDFRVFDFAARAVLEGRWSALYREGPDRFLYAPGFAILFAPLSLFSQPVTHALWLLILSSAFFLSMRFLASIYGLVPVCGAIFFSMRSIWIDLRYGQVNLLILSAAVFALFSLLKSKSSSRIFLSWSLLGIAAVSKIYPLALLVIPFFSDKNGEGGAHKKTAFLGAGLGIALVMLLPFIFSGHSGFFLFEEWVLALGRKGFPTETHNQSFLAFMHRFFSGESFHSLTLGDTALKIDFIHLSPTALHLVWWVFSAALGGVFLRAIYRPSEPSDAYSLAIALCFLPAHLIWKSYFLMGIPLVASLAHQRVVIPLVALGVVLTFSSNEFLGPHLAAWVEASSVFLWIHLTVIGWALYLGRMQSSRGHSFSS